MSRPEGNATCQSPMPAPYAEWERAAAAALLLVCFCALLRRRVEVAHPVYALLLQGASAMALAQGSDAALFFALAWGQGACGFPLWVKLDNLLTQVAAQFHAVTWALVSFLRYTSSCAAQSCTV